MVCLTHEKFIFDGTTGMLGLFSLGQIGSGFKVGIGDGNVGVAVKLNVDVAVAIGYEGLHAVKNKIDRIIDLLMKEEWLVLFRWEFG
jgi:hypothetical protein